MTSSNRIAPAAREFFAGLSRATKRIARRLTSRLSHEPKRIRRAFGLIVVSSLLLIACHFLITAIRAGYQASWTGFGEFTKPNPNYEKPKMLWDWLNLIIIPLVGAGALRWFSHRREKLDRESQRTRFQEEALQRYLDHMTHLVLEEKLTATPHSQVHEIARYRTLTVLRELDGDRKATLLRFLYESRLIDDDNIVLDLRGADLSGIRLEGVGLLGVHLAGTNLSEAKLAGADLKFSSLAEAILRGANLSGADLKGARLLGADLSAALLNEAHYRDDQLLEAKSWHGIMPAKLEERLQSRGKAPVSEDRVGLNRWLRLSDPIIQEQAVCYSDDERETHGRWLVTRGRHVIERVPVFCMGIYPITNAWFFEFVQDGGYVDREWWEGMPVQPEGRFLCKDGKTSGPATWPSKRGFLEKREEHPVAGICYYEAAAFCRWLQAKHPVAGCRWNLPTENMWEIVARSNPDYLYPWGREFSGSHCNSVEAGIGATTPVGRFEQGRSTNGGCYDMAGNVWEFVREDEEHWYCVLRGGAFRNTRHEVKSSLRLWGVARDHRPPDFGFRCAAIRESS